MAIQDMRLIIAKVDYMSIAVKRYVVAFKLVDFWIVNRVALLDELANRPPLVKKTNY